uniref:Ovule protein n=1 Tax=Heterorhabditis bacteriophora TaxID=37862 RepID=A0A1I7WAR2_HETBA
MDLQTSIHEKSNISEKSSRKQTDSKKYQTMIFRVSRAKEALKDMEFRDSVATTDICTKSTESTINRLSPINHRRNSKSTALNGNNYHKEYFEQ